MMAIPAALFTLTAQADNTGTCTLEYALSTEQEQNLLTDASQGDTCAAENLGNYYYSRQHYRKAYQWYEKVASRGNSHIAFMISAMYRNGLLDTSGRDDQQAHLWLVRAAEQGLDLAQVELADQYANGTGVESNVPQGMYWYEQAANQGHAQAQYALSTLYLAGSKQIQFSDDSDLVRRYAGNQAKANYWLCRAALSNLPQAQYELSQAYDTGRGDFPMNQQKESLWLHKAAANGSLKAQAELTWLSQRSALTKAKEYVDNLLTPSETAVDCPHDAGVLDL
jgi:TPR repeat protein